MSTATRERSLILKPHEQAALRAGRLGMLIRPVKLRCFQASETPGYDWTFRRKRDGCWEDYRNDEFLAKHSPFGPVGTEFWTRETWHYFGGNEDLYLQCKSSVTYKSEETSVILLADSSHWRPAVTMPKWASRDTLRLTSLAVKRIQDATEEEAIAWGVEALSFYRLLDQRQRDQRLDRLTGIKSPPYYVRELQKIYEATYGPEAWERNAWCVFGGVERIKGDA